MTDTDARLSGLLWTHLAERGDEHEERIASVAAPMAASRRALLRNRPGLEAGECALAPARGLGRSSPAITPGYYAHFMPEAGSKGRAVIDGLLGKRGEPHTGRMASVR
jgi:hypothetical protein